MELEFLKSLVLIFGVSAIVVFTLGRLRIPSIVGFLVAGVLLGPYGMKLIRDVHSIELLAEIGVILLMFTIGLEFSLKNLIYLRSQVLKEGGLQVLLTTGIVTVLSIIFLDQEFNMAVFNGFLVALSSTAIVMKLLMERAELTSPHGRSSVGILIFQDLCVVPFMLLVPVLSGNGGGIDKILITLLKAIIVIGLVILSARWTVPFILHEAVKSNSRELFVMTIILLCAGTAFLTSKLGLSLALGAFIAGIVISESEYASQAISDILPFKESFTGLFFISVGMLMDINFLLSNADIVIGVVVAILFLKTLAGLFSGIVAGQSFRISLMTGLYISQIGEFSFVLALAGRKSGLITENAYQLFISASVFSMLITPFIIMASHGFSEYLLRKLPVKSFETMRRRRESETHPSTRSEHVIIIGFGLNGRNLASVLKSVNIPYVILDLNPVTVRKWKEKGEPIYYGDGTSAEILRKMDVGRARILVVAISDASATRRIVQIARHENPSLHIIVRTRYVAEVDDLIKLGANEVIPEEFETSIEIFSRVLHHYHVPINIINEHIENIRKDSYSALRNIEIPGRHLGERHEFLKGIDTETYLIKSGSKIIGHSLKELNLRAKTGVTVIAIQRGEEIYQNPSSEFVLKENDVLLLIGKKKDLKNAIEYLDSDRFLVTKYQI